MAAKRFAVLTRFVLGIAIAATSGLTLTGCRLFLSRPSAAKEVAPEPERREASREELISMLQQNMSRFATLSARANSTLINQNAYSPATPVAELQRVRGKDYEKAFQKVVIDGELLLVRNPDGSRKIRYKGTVVGPSLELKLLGLDNKFWLTWPNTERSTNTDVRGKVLVGTIQPQDIRPRNMNSMRPQDLADLFLTDEVFSLRGNVLCYVETWPQFYIMNFLREDFPEHIFSKIWIERDTLTVALHQLFDGTGELIAEGRFRNYKRYHAQDKTSEAEIPTEIVLIWPRDRLVLQAKLDRVRVNEPIDNKFFDTKIPPGYIEEKLDLSQLPGAGAANPNGLLRAPVEPAK